MSDDQPRAANDLVEQLRAETFHMRGRRALLFEQAASRIAELERELASANSALEIYRQCAHDDILREEKQST